MQGPNTFAASLNGLRDRQCRSSGCCLPRYVRPNGKLNRFCNTHRLRQNRQQRAFTQRKKERQLVRHMRMAPMGDEWTLLEMDDVMDFGGEFNTLLEVDNVMDFGGEFNTIELEVLIADLHSLLDDSAARVEMTSAMEEMVLIPIDSIDDLLTYLPSFDS